MQAEAEVRRRLGPPRLRVNEIIDNQVRSLRKRQVIAAFQQGDRDGAYWGIRTRHRPTIGSRRAPALPRTSRRSACRDPTRLAAMDERLQERLINWGYAVCDAAMRRWVVPNAPAPGGFPYPNARVG